MNLNYNPWKIKFSSSSSLTHTYTHTLSLSLSVCLSVCLSHTHTCTHAHIYSLSLSLTHTHTHTSCFRSIPLIPAFVLTSSVASADLPLLVSQTGLPLRGNQSSLCSKSHFTLHRPKARRRRSPEQPISARSTPRR